jgi:hypothetical protein
VLPEDVLALSQAALHRFARETISARQDMGMAETVLISIPAATKSDADAWRMS